MGSRKGEKAALMRQMGEEGAFAPKLPSRVPDGGRRPDVRVTEELLREVCARFSQGETLKAICLDAHMPERTSIYRFTLTDPRYEEMWAAAKEAHAARLMDDALDIADADVKAPDGRVDNGQVQRDRLRCEMRQMRAASLDPRTWGRKTEQTVVGDPNRPVETRTTLAPIEVQVGIRALLIANERAMGLLTDETRSDHERLAAITTSGKPVSPALYEILNPEDEQ